MICSVCQVSVVNNIKQYDRVQNTQKCLVKYHAMLVSNVEKFEETDEMDSWTAQSIDKSNSIAPPTSKKAKPKKNNRKSFEQYENIKFFHFEKAQMVKGQILGKKPNGKYSVLVAKTIPPQVMDISPVFIRKID